VETAWFAEINPAASAVLAHHWPLVPNLGDMTLLPASIRAREVEAPDVFMGGTPCQAFSVAGLRNSLDDLRGNLTLTFVEIADAIDSVRLADGRQPAVILWENVPGVLSVKDNAFGCFLAGLAGEGVPLEPPGGKWSHAGCVFGPRRTVAWRILDAQYFGVAQRRRRIFLAASAGNFRPESVLFEWEGLRRDSAPSREAGEGTACCAQWCFGGNRTSGSIDVAPALLAQPGSGWRGDFESEVFCVTGDRTHAVFTPHHAEHAGRGVDYREDNCSPALRGPNGTSYPLVVSSGTPVCVTGDRTHALRAEGAGASEDGTGRGTPIVAVPAEMSGTQAASAADVCIALSAKHTAAVAGGMQVRRLTPRECERLMGWPDDHTLVPYRGKPMSDGPRYKIIGNGWALPCVSWIARRIVAEVGRLADDATNEGTPPRQQ
jgi:DNA (cytosine-5)-methyltransferase 1